jgi:hypothetical protein
MSPVTTTTSISCTEEGTVSKNWRNQLPIKNLGQYLGNKKRNNFRARGGFEDARTTSGAANYLQHHQLHDDYDDDEECLVTAMYHDNEQVDDDSNDDDVSSKNEKEDDNHRPNGDTATRISGKKRICKSTEKNGMRTAVKQFFSTTTKTIRFGKRKEPSEDLPKPSNSTLASTKEGATTITNPHQHPKPSQPVKMQQKRPSFTSSTPTSSSTNAETPPASPLQSIIPEKKTQNDALYPTSISSPNPPQSDELGQDRMHPLPKNAAQYDDNSIHSMTLQQAMDLSTHDMANSTQDNSYLSKLNASNVTVKRSNNNKNKAEGDASVSDYLQLKLQRNESTMSHKGRSSGPILVETPPEGSDNQQLALPPRRKLSERSTVSHSHTEHNKTTSRTRSMKQRTRAASTTENDESSVKQQEQQQPRQRSYLTSSCSTREADSDPPVRSLERTRQASSRRLQTYLQPSNARNTAPQLERKLSRNRSSPPVHSFVTESKSINTTPIMTSPLRRKSSFGRSVDGTRSNSPQRVSSSSLREKIKNFDWDVDPIISPRTPKRIRSVESSTSRMRSGSSRNRKCSDDRLQKNWTVTSATRSMASASPSSAQVAIKESDLPKNCDNDQSRDDKTQTGVKIQSNVSPNRSYTSGKSRQSSFRSTVSRSKSSDDALSLTGKKKAVDRTLNNGGKEYVSKTLAMSTYRSPLDDEESVATAKLGTGSNYAGKVHKSKQSYEDEVLRRSPGTTRSHRRSPQQMESPAPEKHRRNRSTPRSRSPSVDTRRRPTHPTTTLVSPGGMSRIGLDEMSSSRLHSPTAGEQHSSSQRSRTKVQVSPLPGEEEYYSQQSPHRTLRKKVHHSRSQDLWLMQTPNPGPSQKLLASTTDMLRRIPHSDGKVREKYHIGSVKGRRCDATSTTTTATFKNSPKNLEAPFLSGNDNKEYKAPRRGTRLGHTNYSNNRHNNNKATSKAQNDPRHRSTSPKRKQQQQQQNQQQHPKQKEGNVIVTTSSNKHRNKSTTSGDSKATSTGSPNCGKNILDQHLVATKSKVIESIRTGGSCSVCESTAES